MPSIDEVVVGPGPSLACSNCSAVLFYVLPEKVTEFCRCDTCGTVLRYRDSPAVRGWGGRQDKPARPDHVGPAANAILKAHDPVHSPAHYTDGGIETIDFIEAKGLDYHLGNVIKYVSRAGKKGDAVQDLRKAHWYLERAIERAIERAKATP